MALDIIVVFDDNETQFLTMSEALHSEIFSASTRWSSYKELRKLRDYYKANISINSTESYTFLHELSDIASRVKVNTIELNEIKKSLQRKKIKKLRMTGD
ncbi:hypothetical protein JVX91_20155 [Pseudomonas sp. PDNC002]|uniref:hypothetical protein n=1 Tax=Pseudomonas sp. PDNC002 TaxID=2811422 RepID=UPI001964EA65|nr:hypothetical protein [Pseudomonas sp. PDNC002]QRY77898.1 hypothetical protein JVX91_20155 [Pseudomonas sp. PDNC002]